MGCVLELKVGVVANRFDVDDGTDGFGGEFVEVDGQGRRLRW